MSKCPRIPSWRAKRDVLEVKRLTPISARSAEWLALKLIASFKSKLDLAHKKSEVIVDMPDSAMFWPHKPRAIALLREKGYVVTELTQTLLSFDATRATK